MPARELSGTTAPFTGAGIPAFLDRLGPALTPEQVGTAIIDIVTGPGDDQDAYLLTSAGLSAARVTFFAAPPC